MTAVSAVPRQEGSTNPTDAAPERQSTAVSFNYVQSDSFVVLLHQLRASVLVTTYQANKLLVARATENGLSTLVRTFDQPMGLAVDGQRMTIGTRTLVWTLRNAPDIAPRIEPVGQHDACYLPRSCHVTGDIRVHEIAWARTRGQESGVGGQEAEMEGVAQVVLHGREQLVLLRPQENLLILEVLHYRHQITQPAALADEVPRMEVSPEELHMARTLVHASTADFNLEKYPDLYTRKLEQLIEVKVAGQELVTPPATPGPQVINLMEALRQSVARVQGANGTKKEPRKATRRLAPKIS